MPAVMSYRIQSSMLNCTELNQIIDVFRWQSVAMLWPERISLQIEVFNLFLRFCKAYHFKAKVLLEPCLTRGLPNLQVLPLDGN